MPYVTSIERLAEEEGWERGLKRGIRVLLKSRFGEEGLQLMPEIDVIRDGDLLEMILDQSSTAPSVEQLRECWKQQ